MTRMFNSVDQYISIYDKCINISNNFSLNADNTNVNIKCQQKTNLSCFPLKGIVIQNILKLFFHRAKENSVESTFYGNTFLYSP